MGVSIFCVWTKTQFLIIATKQADKLDALEIGRPIAASALVGVEGEPNATSLIPFIFFIAVASIFSFFSRHT